VRLKALFEPKRVALIGASSTQGKIGNAILENLRATFQGEIIPINPRTRKMAGLPCYPSISAVAGGIDLVVIAVPAPKVPALLRECGEKGVSAAIVISSGFKETGDEGRRLEEKLVETATKYDISLLGPNCLGLISPKVGLNTTFGHRMAHPGQVAVISQSGAFCTAMLEWAWTKGLGFSRFISLGNKAILNEADFLDDLREDPETKVVLAYIEGIDDGKRFIDVAYQLTRQKPLIVLKAGHTTTGARAAFSHTGAMAGSERAYRAAFDKCGAIQARTLEELLDYARTLSSQPLLRSNRIAVVTNAGGPGVLASDAIEKEGLNLAHFSANTLRRLEGSLPAAASLNNPVDTIGSTRQQEYRKALQIVLSDENVDGGLALSAPAAIISFPELARVLTEVQNESGKPILCSFMAEEIGEEARELLDSGGVPHYFDPARAARSLAVLHKYAQQKDQINEPPERFPCSRTKVERIIRHNYSEGTFALGLPGLEILHAYGIKTPVGGIARSIEQAQQIATTISGPVVMKLISPELIHKSDVGGVLLNIEETAVADGYQHLIEIARGQDVEQSGVLVQRQLNGGRELIIGMSRDKQFGPLLMFGLGGIYVEVIEDVGFALSPLGRNEARHMVESIRGFPTLTGLRGEKGVDLDGVIEVILRVSQLVEDFPEIEELDINPLLAFPEAVYAADVRLRLRNKGANQ
jgi:acetyltransferase